LGTTGVAWCAVAAGTGLLQHRCPGMADLFGEFGYLGEGR
jgi:hypothetical protein